MVGQIGIPTIFSTETKTLYELQPYLIRKSSNQITAVPFFQAQKKAPHRGAFLRFSYLCIYTEAST